MSKVVKGSGRSISKVVKGTVNAVTKVVKGTVGAVKKFAKSKLGKIIIMAAAVYFGGAALMGGLKGAAAGQGFLGTISSGLSGAAQGVANAWTSLGTAATQALGGNFANAGNALSTGFQGGTATMAEGALFSQPLSIANAAPMSTPAAPMSAPPTSGLDMNAILGKTPPQMSIPGVGVPTSPPTGLIAGMMSSPYAAPAAIMSGTQLIGGVMQGAGARQEQKRQEQLDQTARNRYNTNIGTRLWGG
jgi:hypothetical protein